jgi:hypothetical protein
VVVAEQRAEQGNMRLLETGNNTWLQNISKQGPQQFLSLTIYYLENKMT